MTSRCQQTWQKTFSKFYTDPCRCRLVWFSISENDDNVRYVTAVTCRWSQHRGTNIGKRNIRVGPSSRVIQRSDGWLKSCNWRVGVQVNHCSDGCRIRDKTNTCVPAVDIQSADKMRQKRLRQGEIVWTDASRLIQHENDINRTGPNCNIILSKYLICLNYTVTESSVSDLFYWIWHLSRCGAGMFSIFSKTGAPQKGVRVGHSMSASSETFSGLCGLFTAWYLLARLRHIVTWASAPYEQTHYMTILKFSEVPKCSEIQRLMGSAPNCAGELTSLPQKIYVRVSHFT